MAQNERQREMLKLVASQGFVSVEAMVEIFDVTPQTIRRDINELCRQGLLRRYHGGAAMPSSTENIEYDTRQVLHYAEKQRIATQVAEYIPDHASIFLNLGTTTEEVARKLCDHKGLRIITNNLNVAAMMGRVDGFEVIIAGGVVRSRDLGITGEATIDFIREFKVDYGIIGVSGIESDGTLRDFDYREVRVSEAIMKQSREVLVVADHSKFGRNALVRLGHVAQVDRLFTDIMPDGDMASILAEHNTGLSIAC